MKKLRGWIAVLAMACGSAGYAADSPLGQISNEADVVIRVKNFDGTVEKLAALVNGVQPGFGDMISQNAPMFGVVLSNPAMAGVDRSKDFYLCLFMREQGEPKALFAIPTTDGEALTKALPPNFVSQVRDNWVFYADKDHGVPEAVSEDSSLTGVLEGEAKAAGVFEKSDVGLHINLDHITKIYEDKLQLGRQLFEAQLEKGLNAPGVTNPEAVVGVLKAEMNLAFKVLEETNTVTIGLSPAAERLQVDHLLAFEPGSDVAEFISRQPKSKFVGLSKLNSGLPVYFGASGNFGDFAKLGMEIAGSMFQSDTFQEGMNSYIEAMDKAQAHSLVAGFDLSGGGNGVIRSTALFETQGAKDLLAASRMMYAKMQEMKIGDVTTKISHVADAESIDSRKIDLVTTVQEFDANNPGAASFQKLNAALYGEGGIQTRMAALADGLLMSQGGNKESMEESLKAYDSSSNDLSSVRSDLPEETHLTVLFDLPGLFSHGLIAATDIPGLPVPFEKSQVEDLQITRSYLTVTAVGGSDTLHVTTRIPVEQAQGIMKLVPFVQSLK